LWRYSVSPPVLVVPIGFIFVARRIGGDIGMHDITKRSPIPTVVRYPTIFMIRLFTTAKQLVIDFDVLCSQLSVLTHILTRTWLTILFSGMQTHHQYATTGSAECEGAI